MKSVLALGGSNSKDSINKRFALYAAHHIKNVNVISIDLHEVTLPLYGIDLEHREGIPEEVVNLDRLIMSADGLIVSLAEHNGAYTTAFKNMLDWLSRVDKNIWKSKPMLLLSTSPGERGATLVLQLAKAYFPRLGARIVADFSLPSFDDNFSEQGIKNPELNTVLNHALDKLQAAL